MPHQPRLRLQHRTTALLALGVSLLMAGCGGKEAPEPEPLVTVQTARVERAEIQNQP